MAGGAERSAETGPPDLLLVPADTPWLANLRGRPVDEPWLDRANQLIETGALHARQNGKKSSPILEARREFFDDLMGFADEEHPVNKAYRWSIEHTEAHWPPIGTFVQTQRILWQAGVDNMRAVTLYSVILNVSPGLVASKIKLLEDAGLDPGPLLSKRPQLLGHASVGLQSRLENLKAAGLDVNRVVNVFPTSLSYETERVNKRLEAVDRIARLLRWQHGGRGLVNVLPALLGYSDEKLMVHARLFAEHGTPDMSESRVAGMIISPLEAHLLALVREGEYTASTVKIIQRDVKETRRKAEVKQLLEDRPALEAKIGKKLVRDYLKYAARSKNGWPSPANPAKHPNNK